MKCFAYILLVLVSFSGYSQNLPSNYKTKTFEVKDHIQIDSVSINSSTFTVRTTSGRVIDSTFYSVDFAKALLSFKKLPETDSVYIDYLKFPDFLTKTYKQLDENIIVESAANNDVLYKLSQPNFSKKFIPFDGLSTSGSISRGVTVGNNQNSVLNSELDLQISGKLNHKVSLRASIQDANIPLQESGYSQRLDEFDQVFIELFSDQWNIRAGDIDLVNEHSYFSSFSKRVQGLNFNINLGEDTSQTSIFAAGAIVRGQFTTDQFTAQEGNQGPYKLKGPNGELFVLIVSGSETVYVNGVVAKRGEDQDYIIDYNAGEIIFNATFPITSEMRISVDYQYSERNYTRFVGFGGSTYSSEKLDIGVSVYSENDAKNQPLQQNLSEEQVDILKNAGDDETKMVAPSATRSDYNQNRILYRKDIINGNDIFVFSNNPDEELYSVTFSLIGDNKGDYILSSVNAISNIYEYAGPNQGNFAPVIQLVAPKKLQIAVVNGRYKPSNKTNIIFEAAGSQFDQNLFSTIDNNNNDGLAGKLKINQSLIHSETSWNLDLYTDNDYVSSNFRNVQGLYNVEFKRDWNLDQSTGRQIPRDFGDQFLTYSGLNLFHKEKGMISYQFQLLKFSNGFKGNRHVTNLNLKLNKFIISSNSSFLNTSSNTKTSNFIRSHNQLIYPLKKSWVGGKLSLENNEERIIHNDSLTPLSQQFKAYETFVGIGDSTKIFAEVGYKNRTNDSIRYNNLVKVNTSNTIYLKSKLIQNKNTNLSVFANYRTLKSKEADLKDENSINSRLQFSQKFFKQIILWHTIFETNSGTLPLQDFTYVEVEPGQGAYTWIDYNNNGIQELEEFELAQFQDQGKFIRVLLPNRVFVKTHQNRLSQTLTINPAQWAVSKSKSKLFWSHFYNQTSYLVDRKLKRNNNGFNLNPFKDDEDDLLGLLLNFRNVLFFNRGKQHYTSSYTYLKNTTRNVLSVGFIENSTQSHQLHFNHKIATNWLFNLLSAWHTNNSKSENFTSKNFNLKETRLNPKISYLFNNNSSFDIFYQRTNKNNTTGSLEQLKQHNYGASFTLGSGDKSAFNGIFNYFSNTYNGDTNTPVAYQILEGLQPGKNFTWSVLAQRKLTRFLDLNLNYFGRKTPTSKTIHTGSIQLKAYF
ncbi:hypothetical protein KFZ70_03840 [Tamlana fucoidanivorans]|uniref:TonB-dependent receptor n=1 Tax=Allotamlana fucoidanivorans TaxID=2583814 RepID=A0A5C4SK04_9FLAO|nr:hypothetical protein [Tamlana fucoidanivorans]TNJ44175.1 hypothetical protein FGF67_09080 [Tamlana fucoidanivorans]